MNNFGLLGRVFNTNTGIPLESSTVGDIDGNLNVTGNSTLNGDLTVQGQSTFKGTIFTEGNPLAIVPIVDNNADIGQVAKRYRTAYAQNVRTSTLNLTQIGTFGAPAAGTVKLWNWEQDGQLYFTNSSSTGFAVTTASHQITNLAPSPGLMSGGLITFNAPFTTFSLSGPGKGQIYDESDGVTKILNWSATRTGAPLNPTTADFTNILMDKNGTLVLTNALVTPQQRRTHIFFGALVHPGGGSNSSWGANNTPVVVPNPHATTVDLANSIGPFNVSGNVYSGNASRQLAKTSGQVFRIGSNFHIDPLNPNLPTLASVAAPITFILGTQTGVTNPAATQINASQWDNNGVFAAVSTNQWSNQRIYVLSSNQTVVEYGQAVYNSQQDAQSAIGSEIHISLLPLASVIHRYTLVVRGGATNLALPADAVFVEFGKFGTSGGGGGGNSTPGARTYHTALWSGMTGHWTGAVQSTTYMTIEYIKTTSPYRVRVHTNLKNTSGSGEGGSADLNLLGGSSNPWLPAPINNTDTIITGGVCGGGSGSTTFRTTPLSVVTGYVANFASGAGFTVYTRSSPGVTNQAIVAQVMFEYDTNVAPT